MFEIPIEHSCYLNIGINVMNNSSLNSYCTLSNFVQKLKKENNKVVGTLN